LADIFDALTAKDRPYKKEKPLSEAIKIMGYMVKDKHIDADLFELFMKERIYLDYARRELTPHQIDMV
jgi:HD-GYP domain-containing protein (c-di-GMP phosphodiesterase class II)